MRIVQLVSTGALNGVARHSLALTAGLARRGHDVLLVHRPHLDLKGVDLAGVEREVSSFRRTPSEIRRIGALIRDFGAEVVHTHASSAHAMGVILRRLGGTPVVATAHSRRLQLHWFANDLVIAFNETGAAFQRRVNLVSRSRITVIPAFLGAQWTEPPTAERRAEVRQRLGIAENALAIGQVADITFDKRQSDMILASHDLLRRRPDAVLVMMGAFYEPTELARVNKALAGFEDRVLRIPRGGDVREVFHALDVFVVSSRREELPTVAVEAMSAGLPMVSTRVGLMEYLLADSGAGLLVAPGDVAAMGEALERLADDAHLRRAMGKAARARAQIERDEDHPIGRIEAALASVARPAPRRRSNPAAANPTTA